MHMNVATATASVVNHHHHHDAASSTFLLPLGQQMGPNDIIRSGPFFVPGVGGQEEEAASSPVVVVVVVVDRAGGGCGNIVTATDG